MPRLNVQDSRNQLTPSQVKKTHTAFTTLPVFPNWFPFNDMIFDGHLRVGKYEGVKTRSWNWDYRGPVLFYNSSRGKIARNAVRAYGYRNHPSKHKIIIGIGDLVEVRPLTQQEAEKMVGNFNKLTPTQVKKLLLQFGPDNPIRPFDVHDYGGDFIAPYEIGFFFQNLKKFSAPIPFAWPAGPIKPIFIPVSIVTSTLKEIGVDPKTLIH